MEKQYSIAEATRLLGVSRRLVQGLIDAGFVQPRAGPRGTPRMSFQDLVVLRAAHALAATRLSAPRIARTLARLRAKLPEVPPERLRVEAFGRSIVVREDRARWLADSGQYLLAFEVSAEGGEVRSIGTARPLAAPLADEDWMLAALALEDAEPDAADQAYRKAIAQDAGCSAAYANLGRLLHAGGRLADAQAVYESGLRACDGDATLMFNLAVLLEDRGDLDGARSRYQQAIALDPQFADAHCNLGLLYERLGDRQGALRHLSAYRQLSRGTS